MSHGEVPIAPDDHVVALDVIVQPEPSEDRRCPHRINQVPLLGVENDPLRRAVDEFSAKSVVKGAVQQLARVEYEWSVEKRFSPSDSVDHRHVWADKNPCTAWNVCIDPVDRSVEPLCNALVGAPSLEASRSH